MAGKRRVTRKAASGGKGKAGADAAPRTVEIAGETADLLQARAAALGVSVADLLAMIAGSKPAVPPQAADDEAPTAAASETPAARWREMKAWIDSWGKPGELPRPKLDK